MVKRVVLKQGKREATADFKARLVSVLEEQMLESGLQKYCTWRPLSPSTTRLTKIQFKCKKHGRSGWMTLRRAIHRKRTSSPNCKDCINETKAYARSCRKPGSRRLRKDYYEYFSSNPEWAALPTSLYHCAITSRISKIGIAANYEKRSETARYQGREYGQLYMLTEKLPRVRAWIVEQCLLMETQAQAPAKLPKGIVQHEWAGSTELRKGVKASWVKQRVEELVPLVLSYEDWRDAYRFLLAHPSGDVSVIPCSASVLSVDQ